MGELGALRWLDCDFNNMNFSVRHSYYWRRSGHVKSTKTEASAKLLPMHPSLKQALLEWRSQSLYSQPGDFVFPSERLKGSEPLDLASVLKKNIQPAFKRIGITTGVGWAHFSAQGGFHAGRDGRTPTHDPRLLESQQSECDEQVFASGIKYEAERPGETGRSHSSGAFVARENR
jgi:integrase